MKINYAFRAECFFECKEKNAGDAGIAEAFLQRYPGNQARQSADERQVSRIRGSLSEVEQPIICTAMTELCDLPLTQQSGKETSEMYNLLNYSSLTPVNVLH